MHPRLRNLLLTATALLALGAAPGVAGPEGPSVVGGAATITGAGTSSVLVNQSTGRAIINWHTFNIGTGEKVQFNQPGSSSVVLNRVTGGLGPSQIFGTLTANGQVFVINRDGVLFGPGSVINTAGFLASTNDIRNSDFMAGRYIFNIPGRPDASIVNMGTITAASGGFAALVAPGVRNSGTISATLGTVALAAGNSFTLDMYGDKLITLAVNDQIASQVIDVATGKPLKSLVTNDGKIRANGGRVELTAAAARTVVDSVINTSGVIKANSIGTRNGMIVLSAGTGASKPAGAPRQTVKVSGTLSAAGKKPGTTGGTILVTGEDIKFVGALVDASGRAGGGKVMIGGDWGGGNPNRSLVKNQSATLESYAIATASTVSVDAGTTIKASATESGHGGKVVLWSDDRTTFAGTILARGGDSGGNGGFVETSSHGVVEMSGLVDLRAPQGSFGTLLLDPADLYIDPVDGPTRPPGATVLTNTFVQNQLALGNFVVATDNSSNPLGQFGDIFVTASVNWSSNSTLTLSAFRDINVSVSGSGVMISNTGAGNLILRADSTGTGTGTVNLAAYTFSNRIDWSASTGKVDIFYNPASYSTPTNFTTGNGRITTNPLVPNQLTAFMLVNSVGNLININTNLTGTYALGTSIDGGSQSIASIGSISNPFSGFLEGNGHTIRNLVIAPNDATTQSIGLFAAIGTSGVIQNLNLANLNVSANPGFASSQNHQWVGTLAGSNLGRVHNVTATGVVDGFNLVGVIAGGLIGQNGGVGPNSTGTITESSANVAVTVGNGSACNPGPCRFNAAGGLVGANLSLTTISNSFAQGNVTAGNSSFAGGLVGQNGFPGSPGAILNSWASGNVSAMAPNGAAGGLVGSNSSSSTITNSQAFGTVTVTGAAGNGFANAGGLVGANQGTIAGTTLPAGATTCAAGAAWTCASGNVSVGQDGTAGGLVGFNQGAGNDGLILMAFASGAVTGASSSGTFATTDRSTNIGGLVGTNRGQISFSHATGTVGNSSVGNISAGGLVSDNSGQIDNSFATGDVRAGSNSLVGGLVSNNTRSNDPCSGSCNNSAFITNSFAFGNVSAGSSSIAGGLAATGGGTFLITAASGNVSANDNSIVGGLVGVLQIGGSIQLSAAAGAVTSTGPNSVVGGFVGVNGGAIAQSVAGGPVSVTGSSRSILGGFVGVNLGSIALSGTLPTATVFAPGDSDVLGGFVGLNLGGIDTSISLGSARGGPNAIVGGFAGINGIFVNFQPGIIPGSSFPGGTITNSSAQGTASGGPGSTVGPFIAVNNPSSSQVPGYPSIIGGCVDTLCEILRTGVFARVDEPPPPQPPLEPPPGLLPQAQIIENLVQNIQLAALNTDPVVNMAALAASTARTPQQPQRAAPANPYLPPGFERRIFDIPPLSETRFIKDEVLLQISTNVTVEQVQEAVRRFGLTLIEQQSLGATTGSIALRFRIGEGQSLRDIIRQLASVQILAVAQPIYVYVAGQDPAADPASRGAPAQQGDAAQYILQKLKLTDVHRIVKGANIPIAVIDSEIDAAHPDLAGVIAQRFSAAGAPEQAHPHGTGMAGAIASRQRLLGVAPSARLLAVHAFSSNAAKAESTTYNILKGLDWSVKEGARIINMSFAGPKDPSLERSLKAAYDKGIVLIAAAGNAGPRSPPLYPGADKNVIAVTATDVDDKLFAGANRGGYVAVAAPGVDILVPAPNAGYQLTTGTSVAAAEVSGVVALLLERNPRLKPADIRRILTTSARRLGPGERNDDFGSGLVDPLNALQAADPRTAGTPPPRR